MSRFAYVLFFMAVVLGADAIAPIGKEPMWKTGYNSLASLRDTMQAHEDADRERDTAAVRDEKSFGLKPIFGGRSYVRTGLPSGPMFGRIEDQIRQGERDMEGWSPPQIQAPNYRVVR